MRNLSQLMLENNITDEQMYRKYKTFKKYLNKNHSFGMSLRMAFSSREQFVLAALGLNYLENTLVRHTQYTEDSRQGRLFNDDNIIN